MATGTEGDWMQLLVLLVVGAGYGVVAVLKRADAFIRERRIRREQREEAGLEGPRPERSGRETASPYERRAESDSPFARGAAPGGPEAQRPPEHPERPSILGELRKTFEDIQREIRTAGETFEEEPPVVPRPRPIEERPEPAEMPRISPKSTPQRLRRDGAYGIQAAPSRRKDLAFLRTPEDVRRAVIASEILGKPRAFRPY